MKRVLTAGQQRYLLRMNAERVTDRGLADRIANVIEAVKDRAPKGQVVMLLNGIRDDLLKRATGGTT